MENRKSEYDKIVEDRKNIQQELDVLKENEFVKRYFELSKIDASLQIEQNGLYTLMKLEEFSSCEHLWVTCKVNNHRIGGYCGPGIFEGCIKCGLNEEILYRDYDSIKTIDEAAMYDVLDDISVRRGGISLNVLCDLELARAIYSKIIENNPDIDEETACKYFEIALDNIRNIEVSDERKVSRAKRLSLNPSFNK